MRYINMYAINVKTSINNVVKSNKNMLYVKCRDGRQLYEYLTKNFDVS